MPWAWESGRDTESELWCGSIVVTSSHCCRIHKLFRATIRSRGPPLKTAWTIDEESERKDAQDSECDLAPHAPELMPLSGQN